MRSKPEQWFAVCEGDHNAGYRYDNDRTQAGPFASYSAESEWIGWDDRFLAVPLINCEETQDEFNARMARGRAERAACQFPERDPFRRLPVLDETPF